MGYFTRKYPVVGIVAGIAVIVVGIARSTTELIIIGIIVIVLSLIRFVRR